MPLITSMTGIFFPRMLAVALAGAAVNLLATAVLAGADRRSLGVEGSFQHLLTDLYAFLATALAAGVILLTGFERADPIASLLVAALMLRSSYCLLKACGRIFLEAAPSGLDPAALGAAMAARPHVAEVHDLHIWEITTEMPAASAHVLVEPRQDCHAVRADLEAFLSSHYDISHATLQVDHAARTADQPSGPAWAAEPHCDDAHGPAYRPADC